MNHEGVEVEFHASVRDLKEYLEKLGTEDAVVLEESTGSFWWSDRIQTRGSLCFVLNPYRFKIIKDSWNKTDARDARNMAKALWVFMSTGESEGTARSHHAGIAQAYQGNPYANARSGS